MHLIMKEPRLVFSQGVNLRELKFLSQDEDFKCSLTIRGLKKALRSQCVRYINLHVTIATVVKN